MEDASATSLWQLIFFVLLWQSLYKVSKSAITVLFKFLRLFIGMLGKVYLSIPLQSFAGKIPTNTDAAHKYLWSGHEQTFVTYVVCPSCDEIYRYDQCVVSRGTEKESSRCKNVHYPNHPNSARRKECGALLLKKIKSGKKSKLVPFKAYPYQSLQASLGQLVCQENFVEQCELWRQRQYAVPQDYLGDIYDGRVWHDFATPVRTSFLSSPYCYLLTLNVDWFQPFLHTNYSVGGVYLTIQNLPRHLRYKEENIMLIGLIPGPREPKLTINSYLSPLVEELKLFWEKGVQLTVYNGTRVTFHLALSCISCDIPASRKVCGFLGHNAKYGCNKCMKPFETTAPGQTNYSGYDRNSWVSRSVETHRSNVRQTLLANTKTGRQEKESELGCRYSVLLKLNYFDPIRYTVIDIMHNLYLGTGKHMFKVWLSLKLLGSNELKTIDKALRDFVVPNSIGRLPTNIESNYGGFKAAQWRFWITVFSPVVLKSVLPPEHYRCWLLYVRACSLLGHRIVTRSDIETADMFLLAFCKKYQELYGAGNCSPNMHLHLHLKECLLDYGPPHAFWCFSFERFNGLLGSFHTNQKSIEVQVMRMFINSQLLRRTRHKVQSQFLSLLPFNDSDTPSILPDTAAGSDLECLSTLTMSTSTLPNSTLSFQQMDNVLLLPPLHKHVFSSATMRQLEKLWEQLNPSKHLVRMSPFHVRCGRVMVCGEMVGSVLNARSCNSASVIMAYWPVADGPITNMDTTRLRVGTVLYYTKFHVTFSTDSNDSSVCEYVCAYVKWRRQHPRESWFGVSAVVSSVEFHSGSMYSFLPVQRIHAIGAHCTTKLNISGHEETVFVSVPVGLRLSI